MSPAKERSIQHLGIKVTSLGKRFNREWIFRNLDYTFKSSNIYAITGPNGSGKSTLLQVLWGQLPQSTGDLSYPHSTGEISVDEIFQHLAIATPYLDLIEEFTLEEHLKFHFRLKRSRNGMQVDEMLDQLMLSGARDKHIANFSSGMKQRVKLVQAIFADTPILLLDEPCSNLDKKGVDLFQRWIKDHTKNRLLIIASNDKREYEQAEEWLSMEDYR